MAADIEEAREGMGDVVVKEVGDMLSLLLPSYLYQMLVCTLEHLHNTLVSEQGILRGKLILFNVCLRSVFVSYLQKPPRLDSLC